jgi:hypothetical protein
MTLESFPALIVGLALMAWEKIGELVFDKSFWIVIAVLYLLHKFDSMHESVKAIQKNENNLVKKVEEMQGQIRELQEKMIDMENIVVSDIENLQRSVDDVQNSIHNS